MRVSLELSDTTLAMKVSHRNRFRFGNTFMKMQNSPSGFMVHFLAHIVNKMFSRLKELKVSHDISCFRFRLDKYIEKKTTLYAIL